MSIPASITSPNSSLTAAPNDFMEGDILNFAALADNKIDILYGELKQVCDSLNIPMFDLLDTEEEQYN